MPLIRQTITEIAVVLCAISALLVPSASFAAGDPAAGKAVFGRCAGCHATTPGTNRVGPSLAGVVGRVSGSEPGFNYSQAMSRAKLTWDDAALDKFLTNPQSDVPGTRMLASVTDPKQRQDVIAYLHTLH
jgi:cytochrome c